MDAVPKYIKKGAAKVKVKKKQRKFEKEERNFHHFGPSSCDPDVFYRQSLPWFHFRTFHYPKLVSASSALPTANPPANRSGVFVDVAVHRRHPVVRRARGVENDSPISYYNMNNTEPRKIKEVLAINFFLLPINYNLIFCI